MHQNVRSDDARFLRYGELQMDIQIDGKVTYGSGCPTKKNSENVREETWMGGL